MATTFAFAAPLLSSSSRAFVRRPPIPYHRSPNHLRLPLLKCSSSEPETVVSPADWTHKLIAGAAGLGFLETSYLTYLKLTGDDAFCPVGGGTCSDVLNSDYAIVFGIAC
ncbi:hypothetical protein V8G54_017092 [Vigna mungo]|uniref:Vitamin K epoxide reductase domain-containing protein n=1 Tax=Vigna mungo TaxID=3915 RepID=A0AAQ3NQ10_VIGMU